MLGTGYQQEVALEKLFMDVAEYNQMIHVPAQVPTLVDLAVRHALARRRWRTSRSRPTSRSPTPTPIPRRLPAPAVIQPTAPDLPARRRAIPRPADVARRRRGAERRLEGRRCSSAPAPSARARRGAPGRRAAGEPDHQDAAGQGRGARRPSAHARRHRPARDRRRRRTPSRLRHASSWSAPTSRTRSTSPSPGRPRSCRSRRIRPGPAIAWPRRSRSSATPRSRLGALLRHLDAQGGPQLPRRRPRRRWPTWRDEDARPSSRSRPTRSNPST